MIPIFNISRGLWKQKPAQWGNVSDVQSGLFHNAERIGIDPADIALAMPMWNPGDQQDYSKNGLVGTNNSVSYENNTLQFDPSSNSYLDFGSSSELCPGAMTVILKTKIADHGSVNQPLFERDYTAASEPYYSYRLLVSPNYVDRRFSMQATINGTRRSFDPSITNTIGEIAVAGFKVTSGDQQIYKNGESILQSAYSGSITDYSTPTYIGRSQVFPTHELKSDLYFLLQFSIGLADDQIASLSDNPYQLWQPRVPTFYSFAAGTAPSGWGHKIFGVSPAKVDGIAVADIGKIDGV